MIIDAIGYYELWIVQEKHPGLANLVLKVYIFVCLSCLT